MPQDNDREIWKHVVTYCNKHLDDDEIWKESSAKLQRIRNMTGKSENQRPLGNSAHLSEQL